MNVLLAAVIAEPNEPAPKLVYADWLEEHKGDPGLTLAYALRWCARRGRHPFGCRGGNWYWVRAYKNMKTLPQPQYIPAVVYDHLRGAGRGYKSPLSAIGALAEALAKLRAIVE